MDYIARTRGWTVSGVVTAVFIAAITIAAELLPGLKDWLKAMFSHHWIGKGALAVALFIALGLLLGRVWYSSSNASLTRWINALTITSAAVALAIVGFFVYEAMGR